MNLLLHTVTIILALFSFTAGAIVPCELLETMGKLVCSSETAESDAPSDPEARDCCTACLTCCTSIIEAPSLRTLSSSNSIQVAFQSNPPPPLEEPMPIWHPPRS